VGPLKEYQFTRQSQGSGVILQERDQTLPFSFDEVVKLVIGSARQVSLGQSQKDILIFRRDREIVERRWVPLNHGGAAYQEFHFSQR
jgi:hypothetical protein